MMRVQREVLAAMHQPYAVWLDAAASDGYPLLAAAESATGSLLMWDHPGGPPVSLPGVHGGCMGLLPATPLGFAARDAWLVVEDFSPVYQAQHSGLALWRRDDAGAWQRRRLFDLPFLHRIAWLAQGAGHWLIAAQLCAGKAHRDDWSRPGAVWALRPEELARFNAMDAPPILAGLHRNHGLLVREWQGSCCVEIAADEGLFRATPCGSSMASSLATASAGWRIEQLCDWAISDFCWCDLDGDGEDELITIEPFHGAWARVYKREPAGRWHCVWETAGEFGHVLWAGRLCGEVGIVLGWRGGEQALDWHAWQGGWRFRRQRLDEGVAPLNIGLHRQAERATVLASLGNPGCIARYTLFPTA